MNILYEEDGSFKVGSIMADNTTSLQIESLSGKRSKVKAANVMLRFTQPALSEFMAQADSLAETIEVDFLWECCPPDEFGSEQIAAEYFGHAPSSLEAAATLIRLHGAPIYFHKKGKGRYRAAPPEVLKAALAGAEKKRQQLALQASMTEQLTRFELPAGFAEHLTYLLPRHGGAQPSGAGGAAKQMLPQSAGFASNVSHLLYKPDRNTLEVKALEAACAATHLSAAHLLQRCGALPSTQDYHLQKFLFEHFPKGTGFPHVELSAWDELPLATASAFSIDDATTTEIDDAFSVEKLANGNWRIGVHIAAPALGMPRDSDGDKIASQRLSTVYMPGAKITMLPDSVVQAFTLCADRVCPALSMYNEIDAETLAILSHESRVERIHIAANLRHDTLEPLFNEETLAAGKLDYPYADELAVLWKLVQKLEEGRGKSSDNNAQQVDYNFHIENDPSSEDARVSITQRRRGSPIDKVVSELMILVNSEWGKHLVEHGFVGIYRTQQNGKVKMSTVAAPHQGLGVAQYMWSSSPLRRYVDMVNQRQIIAMLRDEEPAYPRNDPALYATMRDFDTMYTVYGEFQKGMERYWCLRWLLQEREKLVALSPTLSRVAGEGANESLREFLVDAVVLRENLVKLTGIPLVFRVPSLPELPANTRVQLAVGEIDLLDLDIQSRFVAAIEVAA
ncbi:MAG: putative exoribonuclease II [Candidatus Gallionella acididurans]|uniref:Putative exoribonuclease II n=1 Tax=Candidatus Gallionella acididurans TaxID=1796491 RepID=A0A139BX58_9PROT|nr:MAG: putative exoribonuclease II [Candidatus Gallionella acididurans]